MILLIEEASIFSGFRHGALWSAVYNFPSSSLNGVRANFGTGGIRAGVKRPGVNLGPA